MNHHPHPPADHNPEPEHRMPLLPHSRRFLAGALLFSFAVLAACSNAPAPSDPPPLPASPSAPTSTQPDTAPTPEPTQEPGAPTTANPDPSRTSPSAPPAPPNDPSHPRPPSNSRPHTSKPTLPVITVKGYVTAGVEHNCLLLNVLGGARPYLLIGGERDLLTVGSTVQVSGVIRPDVLTSCQQGTPLEVTQVRPLNEGAVRTFPAPPHLTGPQPTLTQGQQQHRSHRPSRV